jgi:hypothetical protein
VEEGDLALLQTLMFQDIMYNGSRDMVLNIQEAGFVGIVNGQKFVYFPGSRYTHVSVKDLYKEYIIGVRENNTEIFDIVAGHNLRRYCVTEVTYLSIFVLLIFFLINIFFFKYFWEIK